MTPSTPHSQAFPDSQLSDIEDDQDVAEFVQRFYADATQDELLGPMFNDVAQTDWAAHLPKLKRFWCRNLFGTPGYQGNALREHLRISSLAPFTTEHFDRWLYLFHETIDLGWAGPTAERTKAMAGRIARAQQAHLVKQR